MIRQHYLDAHILFAPRATTTSFSRFPTSSRVNIIFTSFHEVSRDFMAARRVGVSKCALFWLFLRLCRKSPSSGLSHEPCEFTIHVDVYLAHHASPRSQTDVPHLWCQLTLVSENVARLIVSRCVSAPLYLWHFRSFWPKMVFEKVQNAARVCKQRRLWALRWHVCIQRSHALHSLASLTLLRTSYASMRVAKCHGSRLESCEGLFSASANAREFRYADAP